MTIKDAHQQFQTIADQISTDPTLDVDADDVLDHQDDLNEFQDRVADLKTAYFDSKTTTTECSVIIDANPTKPAKSRGIKTSLNFPRVPSTAVKQKKQKLNQRKGSSQLYSL